MFHQTGQLNQWDQCSIPNEHFRTENILLTKFKKVNFLSKSKLVFFVKKYETVFTLSEQNKVILLSKNFFSTGPDPII